MTTTAPQAITTGTRVIYHGSITQIHGLTFTVQGTCTCNDCEQGNDWWDIMARNHTANPDLCPDPGPAPTRWNLQSDDGIRLEHARRESFTPEEA